MTRFILPFASLSLLLLAGAAGCSDSHPPGDGGMDSGGGDFVSCTVSSDCIVVPASCCGSCGAATRGDVIAINSDQLGDYRDSVCDMMGCPACYMVQDPALVGTCNAGTCEVFDVRAADLSECAVATDCRVRTRDCCECGGDTSMEGLLAIPIAAENAYMDIVCDEGTMTGCPECAPIYPMEAAAVCDPDGHCNVSWGGMP